MAISNEKLVEDIKTVVSDVEAMLREAAGKTSKEIEALHATLVAKLAVTKGQLAVAEEDLLLREKVAVNMTNEYVHNNAWRLAIIAAFMGFFVGYLI